MKHTRRPSAFSALEAMLALGTALLAIWGMVACARLLLGGVSLPLDRHAVAEALCGLAVPLALWAALGAACALGRVLWPQDARAKAAPPSPPREAPAKGRPAVLALLYAAALALLALGVSNGGMRDVLAKAIKICTECIGLG